MKKVLLLLLAVLAVRLAGRAVRHHAEITAMLWVLAGTIAAANLANTPKARSTEGRLNTLVTQVFPNTGGTINGNVSVTGNHTVTGNSVVGGQINGSGGALENSSGIHSSGVVEADGGVTTSAVTSTGTAASEYSGGIHSAGVGEFDGGITTSLVTANGSGTSEFTGSVHAAGTIEADTELIVSGQRIAPGQGTPGGYPIVGGANTVPAGVANVINGIIGGLQAAGIFTG